MDGMMIDGISRKTKLSQLIKHPKLKKVGRYLIYGNNFSNALMKMGTLEQMTRDSWSLDSIMHGLSRLTEVAQEAGNPYFVYSPQECIGDPQKKEINLIHFPASVGEAGKKPFAIVCAGGAYTNVCSLAEGFPVAARLNELGYTAFVLTYRVGGKALMPKPLEDLAAAVRYVRKNWERFGVDAERYLITGFSAGANMVCLWGTESKGYKAYDLPKPEAMFPVYPLISVAHSYPDKLGERMSKTMFGVSRGQASGLGYDVEKSIDTAYPPCYIVCCKDDKMVPPENSVILYDKLRSQGIPVMLEQGEHGGHGFGEGIGTDAEGWVERAVRFYEGL
ncbi:MAG: alpha/beta hydrolase [Blautia sp.]|nr:alpha/beta hydrolase [Blautia sp.]